MTSTPARRPPYRWTILAAGVVAQASFSAIFFGLPAIAPIVRERYGLSLTQVGIVLAALNVGLVLTLVLWGVVADRIGERTVLAVGLGGCAASLAAAAYTRSAAGLVVSLATAGALGGATQSASGRAVMSWFGAEERGLALGIRQTAVPVGGAFAATALPAIASGVSLRAAFLTLAAGCLLAAAVGASLLRSEPGGHAEQVERPLRDARMWWLCLGSTFYVATQISVLGFLVLFLHDARGLSVRDASIALAVTQAFGGIARIAAGAWSDRARARIAPLRLLGLALALASLVAALLTSASLAILVPVLVVAGTLSLSWNGLSFTAAAELAGRARSGAAIGLQQTFLAGGSIATAIAFAALVHHTSWRVGFFLAGLCPLAGYALFRPLRD